MFVLLSIIILLIAGISSEIKYSNRVQKKQNTSDVKEIVVHKKDDKQEDVINNNDIEEELIENNKEKIKEEEKKEEEVVIVNQVNDNTQEHHEVKQEIIAKPVISQLDEIKQKNDYLGTAGRLYIPNINISVGLNNAIIYDNEEYNAQEIVDRQDSAAYYTFASKLTIADHDFQGFNRIANLNSGDKAFIKRYDGSVEEYQMINKFIGENIGTDLIDEYGNSIGNMSGSLVMYTCYYNTIYKDQIIVTLWNRVS